ncbi:mycothiol system anti-sigma-R factor [Natronoglycomyces albus]|uniref:Mycothiol system anti-sigma-R factor n=1 Tax=Natronoglycomyces albus TaxID=2811108 RepID=A0A895XS40_9ACTN|nr:mycothiol system anti-sigma-R factor [Natronoglycomyces albus]QSB04448.1 mycothiol system anti-sigma-R factor [Natronoglycomyces albus]
MTFQPGNRPEARAEIECSEVIGEVYLYLDAECSEVRRLAIRQHLEECSPCLAEYGIEQEVRTLVHRCCTGETAPQEVKDRLRTKLANLCAEKQVDEV